jgi:hypothetical protein
MKISVHVKITKWPTTSGYVYHEVHISRLYHVGKSSGFWIELKVVEASCV